MAGSKRTKLKKVFSPPPPRTEPPPAALDDDGLIGDLLAELDSRDATVQTESANVLNEMQLNNQADQIEAATKQDPKSRFQARQARKAAAMAQNHSPDDPEADARLQKAADEEERIIKRVCDELGLKIHEITPDGHCLFSAIADQLDILSIHPRVNYAMTREAASRYIYTHPDDFLPFLPSSAGEDGTGATDPGIMSRTQFEQYCVSMRDTGIWGGEPEILALSRAYNVPIHVVQGGTPPVVVHNPSGAPNDGDVHNTARKVVRISYHRRMYGLGEHYNSLRPKTGLSRMADSIQGVVG